MGGIIHLKGITRASLLVHEDTHSSFGAQSCTGRKVWSLLYFKITLRVNRDSGCFRSLICEEFGTIARSLEIILPTTVHIHQLTRCKASCSLRPHCTVSPVTTSHSFRSWSVHCSFYFRLRPTVPSASAITTTQPVVRTSGPNNEYRNQFLGKRQ